MIADGFVVSSPADCPAQEAWLCLSSFEDATRWTGAERIRRLDEGEPGRGSVLMFRCKGKGRDRSGGEERDKERDKERRVEIIRWLEGRGYSLSTWQAGVEVIYTWTIRARPARTCLLELQVECFPAPAWGIARRLVARAMALYVRWRDAGQVKKLCALLESAPSPAFEAQAARALQPAEEVAPAAAATSSASPPPSRHDDGSAE